MVNVQNNKLILSLLLCAVTGIFTACTDETEHLGQQGGTPLSIQVGVNTTQSRAIVTGNSLADGSQIGVAVVDGTGTGYQDQVYNNICYTGQTVDGVQQWVSTDNILLSGEEGTLYAYHPWSSAVTDLSSIAVNMDETDQKDWMVAAPVTDLSDAQSTAAVKMDHVLSNFKLAFYKGNYSGKGVVSAVKIRSNAFAVTGTLDAVAGGFTAYGSTHELSRDFSTTLGTDKTTAEACDVMVVPNNEAGAVTVSVTVDGMTYSSVTAALTLEKGISYNYIMQLTSSGLQITEVTLTDWQTTELGETEFKPKNSWKSLTDGVYAVSADNEPVDYNMANSSCVGVALVAGEHKFMIAKADATDGTNSTFYWDKSYSSLSLKDYSKADETNASGYLPKSDDSYGGTIHLSGDFTTWKNGALSDFNGEDNTAVIKASVSDNRDMCMLLNSFNQTEQAAGRSADWYVPACGKLALIYLNMTEINAALAEIGGDELVGEVYWTSTEFDSLNGWGINFENGLVLGYGKGIDARVRFVRDIK